jgi:release factor glutamine methyltransferase
MYHRRPMPDVADSETLLAAAVRSIERRDAELLLAAATSLSRAQLIARAREPVPQDAVARFELLRARRAAGEPVAYLLGRREFWSLDFEVGPAVLVPRPETELLVERTLALVPAGAATVVDLGTGSGAIAIALAHERPAWRVAATDVSEDALGIARRNGERLVPGRVEWLRNHSRVDWYAPLAGRRFDALVSNPPYIAADDPALAGDGLKFEPRGALTPEGDGFGALLTLINGAAGHLRPGGWIALEHGATQGERARLALVAAGFTAVTSHRDLAGRERVTEGQIPHARF